MWTHYTPDTMNYVNESNEEIIFVSLSPLSEDNGKFAELTISFYFTYWWWWYNFKTYLGWLCVFFFHSCSYIMLSGCCLCVPCLLSHCSCLLYVPLLMLLMICLWIVFALFVLSCVWSLWIGFNTIYDTVIMILSCV